MALTRFPIETTNPKIEVTLPVGRHVLELVVEDSAGLRSAPDQIVIEVRKEVAVPTITGINPVSGIRGNTVDAVINGTNLTGATAVDFSGSGITAKIRTGGTAGQLPVSLIIAADAATGARSFTVKTPAGTAASPTGVAFSVAVEPTIIPVEPRVLPIDIKPIDVKLIDPQPVIAEPQPLTIKPIVAEPQPLAVSPIIAEPKLVVTEPKLVEPQAIIAEPKLAIVEPKAVIAETRAVIAEPKLAVTEVVNKPAKAPEKVATKTSIAGTSKTTRR
ncbi:hypothetical protein KI809_16980 [Geobacter pelophilus]|uniref:Uncharacterized protein n=1 Tax=Geoanaerobacter pelophilus TaxID=60036 RepID=A0AAW4LA99_9BACT|nr:hypothetical protein [Geoanaerobacter pelophilus]MBT0666008.1 hypothetical protein [Geoanaerobacter pelophilus]